jgi:uncharacterized OB-fold protein
LERCRKCAGPLRYEPIAGTGTVYSEIIVHYLPAAFGTAPTHVVGLVELAEQPGLRLLGVSDRPLSIGDEVKISSAQHGGGSAYVKLERIG